MSFAAELLRFPDLFPVRHSGEPWGRERLGLILAGGPYLFHGLSGLQASSLESRYGERVSSAGATDAAVEIRVFRAPESDFLELEPRPWRGYPLELDFEADSVRVASRRFVGRLAWRPRLAAALWTSVEQPLEDLVGVFENFLRILVAYRLNEQGGVLLHSAGVVDRRAGYLFVGPSGAGKTTLARVSRAAGRRVLSDDMNLVRLAGGAAETEQLPFAGDLGQTASPCASYPVAGLFRLEKAAEHAVRDAPAAEALALLVAGSPFLNADRHRMDRLLRNLETLLAAVPLRILSFSPDAGFWSLLGTERS